MKKFVLTLLLVSTLNSFSQVPEMVRQSYPGSGRYSKGNFRHLTPVGNTLYFVTDDGTHGLELFKTDGTTAGTELVVDLRVGSKGVSPRDLIAFNNQLFFFAYEGSTDPGYSGSLYKTDGTAAGTVKVKSVAHGSYNSSPAPKIVIGNTLYFVGYNNEDQINLWKTDGTESGTMIVKDIHPSILDVVTGFHALGNTLFFQANDDVHGLELWKSDGTESGTVLVKDINPGITDSNIGRMRNINGEVYFPVDDGIHGVELWKTDGTESGTVMVKDINTGGSATVENLCVVGNTLFFAANDGTSGQELWKSDGTASGTVMVKDIRAGYVNFSSHSNPDDLVPVGNTLYFLASDGVRGMELWKSDGTDFGTTMVADVYPNSANGVGAGNNSLVVFQNHLVFKGNDKVHGLEPWISDGTEAGTKMLKDIHPGIFYESKLSIAQGRITDNGIFYFLEYDGVNGTEPALWKLELPTLSIEDNVLDSDIKVYPNPIKNSFNISSNNSKIEAIKIVSILGKEVKSFSGNYISNQSSFDISSLQSGIYLVKIFSDHQVISKKIIKQ